MLNSLKNVFFTLIVHVYTCIYFVFFFPVIIGPNGLRTMSSFDARVTLTHFQEESRYIHQDEPLLVLDMSISLCFTCISRELVDVIYFLRNLASGSITDKSDGSIPLTTAKGHN